MSETVSADGAPGPAENLAAIIDGPADAEPPRTALIMDDGTSCSYAELRAEMSAWATTLAAAATA